MLIFALIFQFRPVSVAHVVAVDVKVTDKDGVRGRLVYCKSKKATRSLVMTYPPSVAWENGTGPPALLGKWAGMRPDGVGFFNIRILDAPATAKLCAALKLVLRELDIGAPDGYYNGFHSA
ncbi:unnamed protein product [Agarophyton chilense]